MLTTMVALVQDQFVPFTGGGVGQESLPATPLIYAAYALVWLVLLIYVFALWQKTGKVERELRALTAKLRTAK